MRERRRRKRAAVYQRQFSGGARTYSPCNIKSPGVRRLGGSNSSPRIIAADSNELNQMNLAL